MGNGTEAGASVAIRLTKAEDISYVLKSESGTENAPYVAQWSREQHLAAIDDEDIRHMIFEDNHTGNKIGYAIVAGLKNNDNAIELRRIVITEKGKGYGRRALQLIKELAFTEWRAHRLWLDVREKNTRAQGLYSSEGFLMEGLLRECVYLQGSYESIYIMSILKQEYNG